jgi:hypothetical protein
VAAIEIRYLDLVVTIGSTLLALALGAVTLRRRTG